MDLQPELQPRVSRYLSRPVISWLADVPDQRSRVVDGSLVFADVSGFTALSERLARQGRIGAEILADTISSCFARLLSTAYSNGGSLLKFGGDALLLFFTGHDHCQRAADAAFGMRRELRSMGAIDSAGGRTKLSMSVGVHTGPISLFLVGDDHRELVVTGPVASEAVRMESTADKGEIVISAAVREHLEPAQVGDAKGDGYLLRRTPRVLWAGGGEELRLPPVEKLLTGLPTWQHEQALSSSEDPQHRKVVVAFLKFQGTDELIRQDGIDACADELHRLVSTVQTAVTRHGVFLLGSDVDADGGKLIISGGAPITTGHDERSVLLAAKDVLDCDWRLKVKIGVNSGSTFAGDIGPAYRRTYTVMGDTVNLAARIMARAGAGTVLASRSVLDRCGSEFRIRSVEPFMVKGKSRPVDAGVVGQRTTDRQLDDIDRPLIGRDGELQRLLDAWQSASMGAGRAAVIVGEPGIGKSRLMTEAARRSCGRRLRSICEPYAVNTAYSSLRPLLLQALGATSESVSARLTDVLTNTAPDLVPWAPLLGLALGVELPMTGAVADLDERFRRERLEESVIDLLASLLREPTFVEIEDAHFIDEASAAVLSRAMPRLRELPWLVCVSRRDHGAGFDPEPTEAVTVIRLGPLAASSAVALAETIASSSALMAPERVSAMVEKAGGNPLFLSELLANAEQNTSGDELPDSLEGVILARIDALPAEDRSLLRRLSVFGGAFSHRLARQVFGDELPDQRDAAWARLADFIDVGAFRRMAFRHALVMDGAYNSLPFRVRESLHATVGESIEQSADPDATSKAELLSLHFHKARRYDKAWGYSIAAAEKARTVYANAEAARFYERAIDSAKKGAGVDSDALMQVQESLGDTLRRMGQLLKAELAFRKATDLASADPVVRARLTLKRAAVRQQGGSFAPALRWLRAAERLVADIDNVDASRVRAKVAVSRASVAKDQARPASIVRWCLAALAEGRVAGDKEVMAHASFLLDHGYVTLGQPDSAVYSAQALALFEETGNLWGQGAVLNNWGGHTYWAGRWDEATDLYLRGRDAFLRIGDVCNAALGLDNVGEIRSDQGRYDEAEGLLREALEVRERVGDKAKIAYAMSNLGRLRARERRFAEAVELLTNARELSREVGVAFDVTEASLRMIECLAHSGDADGALDDADALLASRASLGSGQLAMLHRLTGYAQLQRMEYAEASSEFATSLQSGLRGHAAFEVALTRRALGHLAAAGELDPVPHFSEAQPVLDRLGVVRVAEPVALTMSGSLIPAQSSADRSEPSLPA